MTNTNKPLTSDFALVLVNTIAKDPALIQRLLEGSSPANLESYAKAAEAFAAGLREASLRAADLAADTRTLSVVVRGSSAEPILVDVPRAVAVLVDGSPLAWTVHTAVLKTVSFRTDAGSRAGGSGAGSEDEAEDSETETVLIQIKPHVSNIPAASICDLEEAGVDHKIDAQVPPGSSLEISVESLDPLETLVSATVRLTFEVSQTRRA